MFTFNKQSLYVLIVAVISTIIALWYSNLKESFVGTQGVSYCPNEKCPSACRQIITPTDPACQSTIYKDGKTGACFKKCGFRCTDPLLCTENNCCSGCGTTTFPVDCVTGEYALPSQQTMAFNKGEFGGFPSTAIGMLAPNVAQHGKRLLAIHPTQMSMDLISPSTFAQMYYKQSSLAANPEAPEGLVQNDPYKWYKCPDCKHKFLPKYGCRPSATGLFEECGPYALNINHYGNQIAGCPCSSEQESS